MQKLSIKLKSFNHNFIKRSINKIENIAKSIKVIEKKLIFLPTTKRRYTLERSPHIDKKSREQFELKRFKGEIILYINNPLKSSIILYLIRNSILPGIEIEVSIQFFGYLR